jgi:DNA-binding LytR/AlgR family response regulator
MKTVNCIIADDEPLAREVIETYLQKIDQLRLVTTCVNGVEVFNAIRANSIDLLFLDIQMPQLTGMELLRTLQNPPAVIITTAYREFALESYELNVIDYLLKPVSFERFVKAINRFEMLTKTDEPKDHLYIKSDKKMVRVMLKDLLYIEGLKDYVKIHTTTGAVITYQTLASFEERLSGGQFIRVHRSFIVSVDHIHSYSATQVELGKVSIPIGSSYAQQIFKQLNS